MKPEASHPDAYEPGLCGWTFGTGPTRSELADLENKCAEEIGALGRPVEADHGALGDPFTQHRVGVIARYNPDQVGVILKRRVEGRPALEGLAVHIAMREATVANILRAARFLATADLQLYPEGCAAPCVNFDALPPEVI